MPEEITSAHLFVEGTLKSKGKHLHKCPTLTIESLNLNRTSRWKWPKGRFIETKTVERVKSVDSFSSKTRWSKRRSPNRRIDYRLHTRASLARRTSESNFRWSRITISDITQTASTSPFGNSTEYMFGISSTEI